jgi:pyruvate dehydrogenase E2 component (dihydrolipoamide acetyltransferase)
VETEPAASQPVASGEERAASMRQAIARSMARSKREIPHYYLGTHIDLDRSMRWLDRINEQRSITNRLLPAALLLKATALAVREMPELNGHFEDGVFRPSEGIHLGVAVSLREGGLVAPAIHDADRLDLDELMARLLDLVSRARSWRLRSSEMSDPTITVTSLGDRGTETVFPVIIPPQVAIVGFGKIIDEPVAVEGLVGVHPRIHATLAGDHRVTDGHTGGLFLSAIDRLLQEPEQL